jgi:glucosamine--fructose-6-phosphate aminotransferase (isomerizing)
MCGIVGYIGDRQAQPVLFNCLSRLEYRGYDSCGIAIAGDRLIILKDALRVDAMARNTPPVSGKLGIGHTRWATRGLPSRENAHPHSDCSGNIAVVHNGIISNFQQLQKQLLEEGHRLLSETDTEVISHLIEKYYNGSLEAAVERALHDIQGSYAVAVIRADEEKLVVARRDSPLVIGVGDREGFVASDVPAILDYTSRVVYLEEGDIGVVTGCDVKIKRNGGYASVAGQKITWSVEEADRAGYEHFMLKEIYEQPRVVRDTLVGYCQQPQPIAELE